MSEWPRGNYRQEKVVSRSTRMLEQEACSLLGDAQEVYLGSCSYELAAKIRVTWVSGSN